ncbi:recombinase family protein [Aquicoccus sp. G2-2]|uniref:recombinase family protein n=1 Tax=Aquicoccus sp. G2-2 TaxID=3092120 RepID=UPI002AE08F79|nr:recombinase family protein [Aquicoccus sp. G2-2]MEA1112124.1 recombinase family protein [Aquicoccus sp. G2-2]
MQDVVGYIRVSTPRQALEGGSLDEQAYVVRGFCDERKLKLLTIEEDDCSAAGVQGHLYRPGLRRALKIARENNAVILVPSVDRLARHPAVLEYIFGSDVPAISIAERRRVGHQRLEHRLHEAQRDRDEIADRAREGMARAKKRGGKLGNTTNLPAAQRKGAISNAARADRKAQELADFIERTPGFEKMTLREKVQLVNRDGPHNLISEKRDERRLWTESSIRKPLKRAEEELLLRKEMEDELVIVAPNWSWDASRDMPANDQTVDDDLDAALDEGTPVADAYRDHPDFGKF